MQALNVGLKNDWDFICSHTNYCEMFAYNWT